MPPASALVPRDKFDVAAADRAREAGWPAVEPFLGELVGWCLDSNWPVAKVLGPFLGQLGVPVVVHLHAVLNGDDEPAKWHIMCGVVAAMPSPARAELRAELTRLARAPTVAEVEEGIPELAYALLTERQGGE